MLLLPELEGEEGVLAPWHVLLNVDLVLIVGQVGVTLAAHGTKVNLVKGKLKDFCYSCKGKADILVIRKFIRNLFDFDHKIVFTCGRAAR